MRLVSPRPPKAAATAAVAGLLGFAQPALAQQDFSNVEIRTVEVTEGLHMLVGSGGNIGLSTGPDGTFVIDSQYAPLTDRIQAAIREAGGGEVQFLVNTHWHGDHSGGNENFANDGAIVVAHDNVRQRMSTEQVMEALGQTVPPSPAAALPALTFPEAMTFHWNGGAINVFHTPNAHTDGDSIIHFADLNAIHAGDTFFNGGYPFIDVSSGGSLDGIIAAGETMLELSDADTPIIPGHGPLADRADLERYVDVLTTIRERLQSLIDQGRTEDEVVMANPTAEWDEDWGGGFMDAETFTRLAYQSLTQ